MARPLKGNRVIFLILPLMETQFSNQSFEGAKPRGERGKWTHFSYRRLPMVSQPLSLLWYQGCHLVEYNLKSMHLFSH